MYNELLKEWQSWVGLVFTDAKDARWNMAGWKIRYQRKLEDS